MLYTSARRPPVVSDVGAGDPEREPSRTQSAATATDTGSPEDGPPRDPAGVDYAWVMQVTFVTTILLGAPIVALLSLVVRLPTWESRVSFAVRVGALVWILVAVAVLLYARRRRPTTQ